MELCRKRRMENTDTAAACGRGKIVTRVPICAILHVCALGLAAAAGGGEGARDAGAGCPVGWGGGVGRAGERDGPDCESVRRSFPSIQTGEVIVAPSRVSPLASFRHSFPKPFRSKPYVLASINGFVQDASSSSENPWATVNGSWVVSIRSTGRAGFSANIYRTDGSLDSMTDGWHGPIVVHYVAWDYLKERGKESYGAGAKGKAGLAGERGREGEVGILFGSWDVSAAYAPPPGAPWVPPAGELPNFHYFQEVTAHNKPVPNFASDSEGEFGGAGAGAGSAGGPDLESEMAAYGGGQPEVVKIPFKTAFGEAPRVLVGARITCPYDRQAVLALTVRTVDSEGFEVNVARVDQSWALQAFAVDYIAWLPSYNMATAHDMLDHSKRTYGGTGSLTGSPRLASSLPPREDGGCAPYCRDRLWARDLDPYVLPRAQFGGHVLLPPVPTTAGLDNFSYPDARWGSGVLAAGHGLGTRGVRLPSTVQYVLAFDFKDIFAGRRTPFTFTRPPFMLVSARIHHDLVPEHQQHPAHETVSVSVVNVTTSGFTINVLRLDRDGPAWPDRGGRGWLRALALDWLAWEPAVEDITVLEHGRAMASEVELSRYKYFRIDSFDHTHDIIIHLNTSHASPKDVDMADSPLAAHAAADGLPGTASGVQGGRAWLPHYVFSIAGPPTSGSGRIVRVSDTAPQSARTLKSVLKLLNDGLAPLEECHNGGRDWSGDDAQAAWERPASCRRENGADTRQDAGGFATGERGDGGRAWPFAEAFAYIEPEKRWVQIECAGVGCPHRLPLKIAPLMMVASTRVSYPTREFIGTRLPYGGGGAGGGTGDAQGKWHGGWGGMGGGEGPGEGEQVVGSREVSETWVSDFLDSDGGMRLHIYATDERLRAGRLFVGVLGLVGANFTITAHVGRIAPLGTEAVGRWSMSRMVPYEGRMLAQHTYGGTSRSRQWVYFRLSLGAADINANTAATIITVRHGRPMEELSLYLRKDEAPLDDRNLSTPLPLALLVRETGYAAAAQYVVEDPVARTVGGWAVTNPPRTVGSRDCGEFGRIIGGPGLLGHASALQR